MKDLSGNEVNLINGTGAHPARDRNQTINHAYEFDNRINSSQFITTQNTAFLNNLRSFSISLWYQPLDEFRGTGRYETLISRGVGISCPDRNGQWSVGLYHCRKAVFARTNSVWDLDITDQGCEAEIIARTNKWTHLVVTFSGDNEIMAIYRNGVLQETKSGKGDCGTIIPEARDIGDLFIGKKYTGKIDDVIIFNKAMNQEEVDLLFEMEPAFED